MQHLHDDSLLDQAQSGNTWATERLLSRYRDRLCRFISILLDPRLSARVDPEDIVQDALLCAAIRLPGYLKYRPVAFFTWLKSLVQAQMIRVHRQHVLAQRRSVKREQIPDPQCLTFSLQRSEHYMAGSELTPCQQAIAYEERTRIKQVLNWLDEGDRRRPAKDPPGARTRRGESR